MPMPKIEVIRARAPETIGDREPRWIVDVDYGAFQVGIPLPRVKENRARAPRVTKWVNAPQPLHGAKSHSHAAPDELTGYIEVTEAKLPKEFHLSNVVTFPKNTA